MTENVENTRNTNTRRELLRLAALVIPKKPRPVSTRPVQAFDLQILFEAKDSMDRTSWRAELDRELEYFTREYILREHLTEYSYGIELNQFEKPLKVFNPTTPDEDALESFARATHLDGSEFFKARTKAENLGFRKIRDEVLSGKGSGRFFVWVSPPGRKEDGYDTHNFTHVGYVAKNEIKVYAWKNWLGSKQNREFLNKYLSAQDKLPQNPKDLDFLKSPVFLPKEDKIETHLDVIHALDPKREDLSPDDNRWLLDKLSPFRQTIISKAEAGDLQAALQAKEDHDKQAIYLLTGKKVTILPVLRGSCGFSGGGRKLGMTWLLREHFECPSCHRPIESGKGIEVCPHCGAKKEDYGNICD